LRKKKILSISEGSPGRQQDQKWELGVEEDYSPEWSHSYN